MAKGYIKHPLKTDEWNFVLHVALTGFEGAESEGSVGFSHGLLEIYQVLEGLFSAKILLSYA